MNNPVSQIFAVTFQYLVGVFRYIVGATTVIALTLQPAFAGPGGKIASAAFETFWGRIILCLLVIFFLPLIVTILVQKNLATRRANKDLAYVAQHDKRFDWMNIKNRVKECFQRVHLGWQDGDLSDVSQWMTSWYWQNQQSVYLDQWKSQGLENVCRVKKINSMQPLLFIHRDQANTDHAHSKLVVSITAKMQDFLQEKATGKVVEGSKKWKSVETIWTFDFWDGQWFVSDIEESSYSHAYAKMRKNLPTIESTMSGKYRS